MTVPISNAPIVKIQSGALQGVRENNLSVFKGIPYAAPPIGESRWREPQPVAAWSGVRPADAFGKACIQPVAKSLEGAGEVGPQSEDCLYLNVWTPNPDPAAKLPVMVWIHGGALVIGAGSLPLYDGAALAQRGAVVVTFNYRLGPLGFFSHPALEQANPKGPVNFGLLDEIAVLKWVQQNIAAFGGDPNNVMIFGESAGGESVLALFASPLAQGLFHKGIAQSPYGIPSHTRVKAQEAGIQAANAMGLRGANATLQELRAAPAEKFGALNQKGASLAPSFVYGDAALPEPILDIFQKGKEAPLPLIIGSNSDESTVAVLFGIDPAKLIEKLGVAKVAVKRLYPGVNDDADLGREVIRDLIFTAFVKRIADLHAPRAPSWRYYFSYLPEKLRGKVPGVSHGGEIVFVFDTGALTPEYKDLFTDADRAMAKRVGDYWHAFAQMGKPDPASEPAWSPSDAKNDTVMEFGETIALQENFMKARLDVFVGLLNILGKLLDRE
ncbi:MAG: carboxylesterase/lipase family protein [Chloroflexi bacterium]|nr:carboxylesterase/lipase family protein [Chloroflexota bacterium]